MTQTNPTDFDVFMAHNSHDKAQVEAIGKKLKERGLKPWLDKEQIPPGRWFQDVIQAAIPNTKSAAIFIGLKGLGRWQSLELRSFISKCVENGIPVISVLLPGVDRFPDSLPFLKELHGRNRLRLGSRYRSAAYVAGTHPQGHLGFGCSVRPRLTVLPHLPGAIALQERMRRDGYSAESEEEPVKKRERPRQGMPSNP
jgi:hypothetical protein